MLNEKIENIETDLEFEKFKSHVDIQNNNRIIFSAPFGSGKTYFLKKFFENYKDNYNAIFINPVKYSVASNTDIFELIKFDIIIQLFENGLINSVPSQSDFDSVSTEWAIANEISNDKLGLVGTLSKVLPLINPEPDSSGITMMVKILPVLFEAAKTLNEKRKKHVTKTKKDLETYEETLKKYIEDAIEKTGHVYEQDNITNILRELLNRIKESKKKPKKNILIIDDFDRLDPEHIFRILNVLSVHNDSWHSGNKFGFDKIIIVCDIDNIEQLFLHRYGAKSDFSGYIDKFCSTHYYRFSIEQQILSFLQKQIPKEDYEDVSAVSINPQLHLLTLLLSYFIRAKKITLRNVLKCNFEFTIPDKQIIHSKLESKVPFISSSHIHINTSDISFLKTLKVLVAIWGDVESLMKDLEETGSNRRISHNLTEGNLDQLLIALAVPLHLSQNDSIDNIAYSTVSQHGHIFEMNDPQVQVCGITCRLSTTYSRAIPYKGLDSFFSKSSIIPMSLPNENKYEITYTTVLNSISTIIKNLKQKQFLKDFDF